MSAIILTPDLGAGVCAFGVSFNGLGESAIIQANKAKIFIKEDGTQGDIAKIDITTGDYKLDDYGNKVGDDLVNHLVYLALFTQRGSSIVEDLGLDLQQTVITNTTQTQVENAVQEALQDLIDRDYILLLSTIVDIDYDRVNIIINYKDLLKNQVKTFTLNG